MNTIGALSISERMRPILGCVRATTLPPGRGHPEDPPEDRPFVTISRQAGAGGRSLARSLATMLNDLDCGGPAWSCFDRELVERVAQDCHISAELIESLEDRSPSWLMDFFGGLSSGGREMSDIALYRRVAATTRALAQVGRVIIVGLGGVFITRHMIGGVHVRLVAPLEYRVRYMAELRGQSQRSAAEEVHHLDRAREAFYRRFWPSERLVPETFTLTLNTAEADEEQMARCIASLLPIAQRRMARPREAMMV